MLVQIIGFLGTALFFASYQCKRNQSMFRVQLLSYLCYTTHLLLLGAFTGGLSYIINTIRSFCLSSKWSFARGKAMCAILCAMQLLALALTWSGWISLLPVAANIAATIGGYTHNGRTIRMTALLVNSPLWMIYDVIVGSWAGILDELITGISIIISIIRYGWKNLGRADQAV